MKSIKINDLAYKEALRLAEKYNIIDLDKISQSIEEMQRKEILENHPYTVWQNAEGLWLTYLPDEKKGRVFRKRRSKEEIENLIVDYYHQQKKKVRGGDSFVQNFRFSAVLDGLLRSRPARRKPDPARKRTWP